MMSSGMNFVTAVIGFAMSATFILFVCSRIICGRVRRSESRAMFEVDSSIDLEQPVPRPRGLELVTVAAIPTTKYSHEAFESVEDAQCSICLGEYQEKEVLRILPNCGHNFHLSCIDVWLRKQSTCPVCRFPIQDSLETKRLREATLSMAQSADSPETSGEHSRQWLLPALVRSVGNNRGQGHLQPVSGSQDPAPAEPETR